MKVEIILLFILLLTLFFLKKSTFENVNNSNEFKSLLKWKRNIVICGNSPKFVESFKNVVITPDTLIIRFNSVLDHLPSDSKTDILFISSEVKRDNLETWKRKCRVYDIEDIRKMGNIPNNYTSGLVLITFLLDINKDTLLAGPNACVSPAQLTLVGFDLPDTYSDKANWFGENTVWNGHDISMEKQLLKNIVLKNNITRF